MKQIFAILLICLFSFKIASAENVQNYVVTDTLSANVQQNITAQFKAAETVIITVRFKNHQQSNFTSFHKAFEIATAVQQLLGKTTRTTIKLSPEQVHDDGFSLTLQTM